MSKKPIAGVVLMSVGAVATVTGALMYVVPGPGMPVLLLGLALMTAGTPLFSASLRRS